MRRVEAGTAATIAAIILGTVPAVGGYSNATKELSRASVTAGGDFSTVGIVTQVEGGAFAVESGKSAAHAIEVGSGVLTGDRMWVESGGLVRVTDTESGRLTVSGPASLEFIHTGRVHTLVKVFKGAVKFRSAEGQTIHFENALAAGTVAGEGALWASDDTFQALGLSGDVKVWHPHLAQAAVLVTPGFFTESSAKFKHLQPKRPARVDSERFETFLSRFEEGHAPIVAERALASVGPTAAEDDEDDKPAALGTRTVAQIREPKNPEALQRLKAHLQGKEFEPAEDAPLKSAGPRFDAYSRARAAPSFEIVKAKRDH